LASFQIKAEGKGFPSKCHPLSTPPVIERSENVISELFKSPINSFVDVVS